jgi:hypothetical protein
MMWLITIFFCLSLLVAIWHRFKITSEKYLFTISLLAHWVSAIGVVWLYTVYYKSGDLLFYQQDLDFLYQSFITNSSTYFNFLTGSNTELVNTLNQTQERSLFFIRLISILHILSSGNFYLTCGVLSTLVFLSAQNLISVLNVIIKKDTLAVNLAFALTPSVVFWSSALLKESLTLLCLYLLLALAINWPIEKKKRAYTFLCIILISIVLFKLRYFVFIIFIPLLILLVIWRNKLFTFNHLSTTKKVVATIIVLFLIIACSRLHPNLYLENIIDVLAYNNLFVQKLSDPGHYFVFENLHLSNWYFLIYFPLASFSGMFRPFLWEVNELFPILLAIENLLLLTLLFAQVYRFAKTKFSDLKNKYLLLSITYIITLSGFLTLATPNFGSLSRYRIVFLPFLVFWLCYQNPIINKVFNRFSKAD